MDSLKFVYTFLVSDKVNRLRVLIFWSIIALLPSLYISWTIQGVQTQVVGVGVQPGNSLIPMLAGSSILPVLFTITGGLRGYHKAFSGTLISIFSKFERKTTNELEEEYGKEESALKIKKVDTAIYFSAFFFLEAIIVGWDLALFPFLGSLSTLGLFGYLADNLLLGAFVLILEGFYTLIDGIAEAGNLYRVKIPSLMPSQKNVKESVDKIQEDPWDE